MAKKKPVNDIKTGRNLPHRFNSYSPSHRGVSPRETAEPQVIAQKKPKSFWKWAGISLLLVFLVLLVLVASLVIWDARNISAAETKMFGTGNIFSLLSRQPLKGAGSGRVNILLVGYSADDPLHQGANLTDSILLLSMSTTNHTGYMLSIPRDLAVKLGSSQCQDGANYCKINEAYEDGGMGLLEQTVSTDFQVPIDYYALIDYSAVRDVVNALGGVSITVNSPDGRLYDPNRDYAVHGPLVDLTNGNHVLNGDQALDFTRARGDPSPYGTAIGFEQSDFQRTADQRQVVSAIKAKLNWKLVLNPRQNSQILNAAADNVKTDIQATEIRSVFGLFNSIPNSKLQSLSLNDLGGKNYLTSTYYAGETQSPAAGIDDYSQIDTALQQISQ
ncbi:MAG: LCP family protein [Candidatus Saccharimonadales bacterium]